ncbi:MAG: hypothetical protein NZ576_10230, partial [Bacteroidia bacterium]|nr:hypothetical protein [Bacteroidia bacterium]
MKIDLVAISQNTIATILFISTILPFFLNIIVFFLNRYFLPQLTVISLALQTTFLGLLVLGVTMPLHQEWNWFSPAYSLKPLTLGVYLDSNNLLTGILVAFISTLVSFYSRAYMAQQPLRYWLFLSLFVAGMQLFIFAPNLIQTYLGWEILGISSFFLIGFWHHQKENARAAIASFWLNRIGDAFLLIAILIFYFYMPQLRIPILEPPPLPTSTGWFRIALVGIIIGALTKAAQFPFQIWLPWAMAGPTPISALMHAATLVAAGILLLLRFYPLFPSFLLETLFFIGLISALSGAIAACTLTDAKKILAFSTISQLGIMVMALGLESPTCAYAHFLSHALFKAGLFLAVGAWVHLLHSLPPPSTNFHFDAQDISSLGGFRKIFPFFSILFILLLANLIGLPLTAGGITKSHFATLIFEKCDSKNFFTCFLNLSAILFLFLLTAFYATRLYLLICEGSPKWKQFFFSKDSFSIPILSFPLAIVLPVAALSFLSILIPYFLSYLTPIQTSVSSKSTILTNTSMLLGVGMAIFLFQKNKLIHPWGKNFSEVAQNHFFLPKTLYWLILQVGFFLSKGIFFFEAYILDKIYIFSAAICNTIS